METNGIIAVANCADGTHDGNCTFIASQNLNVRNLLVSFDETSVGSPARVRPCSAGGLPIGVATDEVEAGQAVNVHFLGGGETVSMVAAEPIDPGAVLVASDGGKVEEFADEGEVHLVGIAIGSAISAGDRFEVLPHVSVPLSME
jgi:hypothetical protein